MGSMIYSAMYRFNAVTHASFDVKGTQLDQMRRRFDHSCSLHRVAKVRYSVSLSKASTILYLMLVASDLRRSLSCRSSRKADLVHCISFNGRGNPESILG
ncbi:hypothetical protein N7G274_004737 [Stereocaulon virgatum]|uniref:Uncharacterized protein n=1 Tax=Stereocaulon virgatum TaxID=373712 RepID=A0ABR4A9W4_9LECA